jgi:type VI secretion system secreted protein Hcp
MAKGDMFLKIDGSKGPIKGESDVPEHLEEIEISEWGWSMSSPNALGSVAKVGRTALSEIKFSKTIDCATTPLMSMLYNNETIKKGVLTVRKAGANPPVDYLVVTIENGRLTSHSVGTASPGSPVLAENFSVAFEKVRVEYAPQLRAGGKGAQRAFEADVSAKG